MAENLVGKLRVWSMGLKPDLKASGIRSADIKLELQPGNLRPVRRAFLACDSGVIIGEHPAARCLAAMLKGRVPGQVRPARDQRLEVAQHDSLAVLVDEDNIVQVQCQILA